MRILYFAPLYYDDMKLRPQQIAECLARKHEVYYIEPTVSLIRWMIKKGRSFKGDVRKISRNLICIRLNGLLTFHKSIELCDVLGINNLSEYMQIKKLADTCDLIWTGYSGWYTLVRHLKGRPVVFDWMDQEDLLVSSWLLKQTLIRNKKKLLQTARAVFVTCSRFYEEAGKINQAYLVPNALSRNFLSAANSASFDRRKTKPRIFGYVGTIGEWFDFEVVRYILRLHPDHKVVLAGKNRQPLFRHERVIYLGIRPHEQLPDLIRSFDICLYNFKRGRLLHTINPVKIYEYLAAQRPVLAVSCEETRIFKEYVMLYENLDDIRRHLKNCRPPFSSRKEYLRFIEQNTWENRTAKIERVLQKISAGR